MNSIEEFGNTVEEAREKAFRALGLRSGDLEDVEVEVLSEGSPGNTAGWGRKLARVRVSVPVPAQRVDVPRRDEPRREEPRREEARRDVPRRDVERGDRDDDSPKAILQHVLDLMQVDGTVEEDERDGQMVLNVVGPDLAILIGKYGQTLEALQFVINLIVNKNATDRRRIIVDVSGYRQRRENTLRDLAQRMARRAAQEQCTVALEPMQASERRIIHLALAEDPEVATYSQGEEPMRKVIIAPRR